MIVSRRNEFLRELFRLLRTRDDFNTTSLDDEDEGLGLFLRRFDIGKGYPWLRLNGMCTHLFLSPEQGSIVNLTDDEISFPTRGGKSPHAKDPIDPESTHSPATSTRTTRSRARAEASSSDKASGSRHANSRSPHVHESENMAIDVDVDDDDEQDLIAEAARERIRNPLAEGCKITSLADFSGGKIEAPIFVDQDPSLASETPKKDEVLIVDIAPKRPSRPPEGMDVEEHKGKTQEPIRDKDDAIDAEEVEAITKPTDAEATTVDDKMDVSLIAKGVHDNTASRQLQTPSLDLTSPSPVQVVGIQQATHVEISSQTGDKLTQPSILEAEAESIEPATHIDNYRFNPTYPLPSLGVLPADFTKKAKPIKRKKDKDRDKEREKDREGKRDKDDNVPMGLSRWAATLMANPLWRKVSRASKTLSTHDWSVRICISTTNLAEICLIGCDD